MMRRQDKALSGAEIMTILQVGEYGVLSTVDEMGQPYGIPLNFVYHHDVVYFHCALEGHKLENITANSRVSFCIVGRTKILPGQFNTEFESVILSGRASICTGEEKHRALIALVKKYSPDFMEAGQKYIDRHDSQTNVIKIEIATMSGKAKRGKSVT